MTHGRLGEAAEKGLLVLLVIPIFFQLDGRLYTDPATLEAPRGFVTNLPLPLSVLACAVAVLVYARRWSRDRLFLTLAAAIPLMVLTSLMVGSTFTWTKAKLLLFQFALPFAGFAVGRELVREEGTALRAGRWILIVSGMTATAHLLSTWFVHGRAALAEDIFGLAVYGHLQYVPSIVVTLYVTGLFAAWEQRTQYPALWRGATALVPVMALYAAASMSMTAMLSLWLGLTIFVGLRLAPPQRRMAAARLLLAMTICVTYVGVATSRVTVFKSKYLGVWDTSRSAGDSRGGKGGKESYTPPEVRKVRQKARVLANMSERLVYWRYFAAASTSDARTFLTGHAEQPDLRAYPSAHNYYLDLLYNFGSIALVPILMVLAMTLLELWRQRHRLALSPALLGLSVGTLFLLLVDNGMRVGMRQPYPGLATFALWGMLTRRLQAARDQSKGLSRIDRTAA